MPRIRSVFIERDDPRASLEAIKAGVDLIEKGFSLVIYPEGTRSKGPIPGPFMKGSLKLATKPGVPIVPVAINGAGLLFDDHIPIIKGGPVRIEFLEPIPTKDLTTEEKEALPDRVHELIASHVKNCTNGLPPM